jgi:hypothetical protein
MKQILFFIFIFSYSIHKCFTQETELTPREIRDALDELYIEEIEDHKEPDKVLHAEPLYIDLIRDLGARKGEKEWNVGFGITDNNKYDSYLALVEYEWAPVNRLGLEVELPFTLYYKNGNRNTEGLPASKLNGFKAAMQYSFFVSEKLKTSIAIGYLNELEMPEFKQYKKSTFFTGNIYNPFFIIAKRWGNNFHNLIYTGPVFEHHFRNNHIDWNFQINTNVHYMITGTRNFIGVELNKEIYRNDFDMIIRPQMRLAIIENFLVGIVAGIPIKRENERFSAFVRLIYEPGHKKKPH